MDYQDGSGKTLLHHAAIRSSKGWVDLLLGMGFDACLEDKGRKNTVYYAVESENDDVEVLKSLLPYWRREEEGGRKEEGGRREEGGRDEEKKKEEEVGGGKVVGGRREGERRKDGEEEGEGGGDEKKKHEEEEGGRREERGKEEGEKEREEGGGLVAGFGGRLVGGLIGGLVGSFGGGRDALILVAIAGKRFKKTKFLIENGADVNSQMATTGDTCLHLAISSKHEKIARLLVRRHARVDKVNYLGRSALELAEGRMRSVINEELMKRGNQVK